MNSVKCGYQFDDGYLIEFLSLSWSFIKALIFGISIYKRAACIVLLSAKPLLHARINDGNPSNGKMSIQLHRCPNYFSYYRKLRAFHLQVGFVCLETTTYTMYNLSMSRLPVKLRFSKIHISWVFA